jgi:hypothetical protein
MNRIQMNQIPGKKLLAIITAAGLLTVGAAGAAFAAENGPGTPSRDTPAAQEQTQFPSQSGGAHRGVRRAAIKVAAQAAAATIGVEVAELRDAVRSGQTVGGLAESKGVSADSVVSAVAEALDARIDQAVTDGKVDEARAAKVKERVPEFARRLVNTVPKRFQTSG